MRTKISTPLERDRNFYFAGMGIQVKIEIEMNIRVLFLSVYRPTIKCHRESYTQKCSNRCSNYPVTSDKERNCNFARIGIRIKIEI